MPPSSESRTRIVLLGTGTPNANPEHSGPAIAIVVDDRPFLIDFGPGVVRRAAAACQMGIEALNPTNLKLAFLTHLHSDHTAGYPDLILTPWVLGRDVPLEVYGPPGLASMTEHTLKAHEQDIRERLEGLEPANEHGHKVNAYEIEPGICWQDPNLTIEAFPVQHGSWLAYGYKFTTPDRTIVISGDTTPVETIIEHSKGCDVLIHEVYSAEKLKKRTPDWQRYHTSVHTSTHELAQIASQTRPGLLILVHQLYWGASDDDLLVEIREGYDGPVVSGSDLDVY